MARLDVTKVLDNPAFKDLIDVIRSTETIDSHGMTQISSETYSQVSAVVTQAGGDILRRQAAGERIEGTVSVYTKFRLTDGRDLANKELTADIVIYPSGNGNRYTVDAVKDYSRWGVGFVAATCRLLPVEPTN